jgi:hypothetical protein
MCIESETEKVADLKPNLNQIRSDQISNTACLIS